MGDKRSGGDMDWTGMSAACSSGELNVALAAGGAQSPELKWGGLPRTEGAGGNVSTE